MKKIFSIYILTILLLLVSCSESKTSVPDVIGIDEESAKQILINSGLIPEIYYVSNDTYEKGKVAYSFPDVGYIIKAEEDKRIQLFISVGRSEQYAKSYECADSKNNGFFNFELQSISIVNDSLKMIFDVEPLYDGGGLIKLGFLGSGNIVFNDRNQEIPITYKYDKQHITYKENQRISLTVPLDSLGGDAIHSFILTIDFNINQPDSNFNSYDKTSTASTFWWKIEW